MDSQTVFFVGALTLALAVSVFILWGPSKTQKRRQGQVVGLVNLGSTCFLNTLLQALSSCAFFVEWLGQQKQEEGTLTSSLHSVLWILNGKGGGDLHAPVDVLNALKKSNWVVPSGEQDAHELFHIIVSTLQEENKRVSKTGSISDALIAADTLSEASDILLDCPDLSIDEVISESSNKTKSNKVPFERGKGDTSIYTDVNSSPDGTEHYENVVTHVESQATSATEFYSMEQTKQSDKITSCGDVFKDDDTLRCNSSKIKSSLELDLAVNSDNHSPEYSGCYDRISGASPSIPQHDSSPFQGLLTSTLQCSVCGRYSSVRYDTFDSLSLPLVNQFKIKLEDLLKRFVKTEMIHDVDCEKCQTKTIAFKTMNFGKLPICLCLHVSRTTWHTYSSAPAKRDDLVDFPEYLPLDEYKKLSSNIKKSTSANTLTNTNNDVNNWKHLYRLKSVVVHVGGVSSGHFLTYRRGILNSNQRHRWYLTSDDKVEQTTLYQAMSSPAYMLFYEKCSPEESAK